MNPPIPKSASMIFQYDLVRSRRTLSATAETRHVKRGRLQTLQQNHQTTGYKIAGPAPFQNRRDGKTGKLLAAPNDSDWNLSGNILDSLARPATDVTIDGGTPGVKRRTGQTRARRLATGAPRRPKAGLGMSRELAPGAGDASSAAPGRQELAPSESRDALARGGRVPRPRRGFARLDRGTAQSECLSAPLNVSRRLRIRRGGRADTRFDAPAAE